MNLISFSKSVVPVTAGEMVRFVLRNTSDIPHEFTIGTAVVQEGRRAVLTEMTQAETLIFERPKSQSYDGPNAVLVLPGEEKVLLWKFTDTQDLEFGCNLPGHYEMGMQGDFEVNTAPSEVALRAPEPADVPAQPDAEETVAQSPEPSPAPKAMPPGAAEKTPMEEPVAASQPLEPTDTDEGPEAVETVSQPPQPAPKPARKAAPRHSFGVLQLAAQRNMRAAKKSWRRMARKHARILAGKQHFIVRANLGRNGIFYRLRVGGFTSRAALLRACAAIRQRGDACISVPPGR